MAVTLTKNTATTAERRRCIRVSPGMGVAWINSCFVLFRVFRVFRVFRGSPLIGTKNDPRKTRNTRMTRTRGLSSHVAMLNHQTAILNYLYSSLGQFFSDRSVA